MNRLTTQDTQQLVDIARSHGVTYLALFGSVARGEERPDSDVDLAVRFGRRVTLFDLVDLQLRFQKILARSVDLIPLDDIYSFMHDSLNRDRVVLYDAANHPPNSPKIPAKVSTSRSASA